MADGPILIVDDDDVDRESLRRLLTGSSDGVIEAATAAEGIRLCRDVDPSFVFLDFRLPDSSGLDFLDAIAAPDGGPTVPVVMLSGHGSEEVAAGALSRGAQGYLVKGRLGKESVESAMRGAYARFAEQRRSRVERDELREFAHTAAHDLRAPLRRIRSYTGMLVESIGSRLDDSDRAVLDSIGSCTQQMQELVDGLLDFARSGRALELEPVELGSVLQRALGNLSSNDGFERVEFRIGELPLVTGNLVALSSVLQNLLHNAVKFNDADRPVVDVRATRAGDEWIVEVSDNGPGIPAELREEVFSPFRQLNGKAENGGSGLGLATCRRIMRGLNGRIECRPRRGGGATFLLGLPAAGPPGGDTKSVSA